MMILDPGCLFLVFLSHILTINSVFVFEDLKLPVAQLQEFSDFILYSP